MLGAVLALAGYPATASQPGPDPVDRYRQLVEDLHVTRAQTEIMQRQIADLQTRMAAKRAAIGRVASASYRGYRVDPLYVLADVRSGEQVLQRLSLINAYAQRRQQEIDSLALTRARYEAVQRTLESLIAQQKAQQQQLSALRLKINR